MRTELSSACFVRRAPLRFSEEAKIETARQETSPESLTERVRTHITFCVSMYLPSNMSVYMYKPVFITHSCVHEVSLTT